MTITRTGPDVGSRTVRWVHVPAGTCLYGDARKPRPVPDLLVAETPLTAAQCGVGDTDLPITGISYDDAVHLAAEAGGRLPTSVEWEWIAAGPSRRLYPWGDEPWTPDRALLTGAGQSPRVAQLVGRCPAGATPHGVLELAGNVWEWTASTAAAEQDEVFKALVLARILEPTSKLDSVRVLDEAGAWAPSYATNKRRLRLYATGGKACDAGGKTEGVPVEDGAGPEPDPAGGPWRARLARACAEHVRLGPATLLLYDVTTLYFEADEGDGFREPGFSKERRLEPQITVGLLTRRGGVPADGARVRGQPGRDQHHDAGPAGLPRRAQPAGCHRHRRCRDGVGGEPTRD